MFFCTGNFDEIRTLADGVSQCCLFIKLRAQLVKIGHAEFGAQLYFASVRCQFTQNNF